MKTLFKNKTGTLLFSLWVFCQKITFCSHASSSSATSTQQISCPTKPALLIKRLSRADLYLCNIKDKRQTSSCANKRPIVEYWMEAVIRGEILWPKVIQRPSAHLSPTLTFGDIVWSRLSSLCVNFFDALVLLYTWQNYNKDRYSK